MANVRILGTDFSEGVRTAHYTNGRLLTAEDLRQDQKAALERLAALGKGLSRGVIEGFEVTAVSSNRSLRITAGLGINGEGTVVELNAAEPVILPVQPVPQDQTPIRRTGCFERCLGGTESGDTPLEGGAYLLKATPLAQLEGSVPRRSCDETETATCANQWEVEGIELKIVRLTEYSPPTADRADRNRNLLAHWFYGSDRLVDLMRDPFSFDPAYSGFTQIAAEDLTPCDLPLAVFYWRHGRIDFVDMWAVRRRVGPPCPTRSWRASIGDRRLAEGEARFLQFQTQLGDLQSSLATKTSAVVAADYFAYLPPAAFLPVNPFELLVHDVFETALSDEHRRRIEQLQLTLPAVLERVRAGVRSAYGNDRVFELETFFSGLLPNDYQVVHEDDIYNRLHESWIQAPIGTPLPPRLSGHIFDLVDVDSATMTVATPNLLKILEVLQGRTSANVVVNAPAGSNPAFHNVTLNSATLSGERAFRHRFVRPWDVLLPQEEDEEGTVREKTPLVDIWVIGELLAPYRLRLVREMPERIDAAITALTSGGGVFADANLLATTGYAIARESVYDDFLLKAANTGQAHVVELLKRISSTDVPVFYVMFVRHRPPVESRRLRP